uniref:Pheromone receptor CPRa1p n=1 Tax=Ganoderma boninense TaxID=34458 RepID=A0A5K1K0Q2_9APHY|nr:Pheromone receptor CPRa1p [Ganoderma boninense]
MPAVLYGLTDLTTASYNYKTQTLLPHSCLSSTRTTTGRTPSGHTHTMDSVAETRLQHYTPGVYKVLADILLTAFLFGCLTVLSIVSAYHLICRGIKQLSTAFLLVSVLILYTSTAADMAVKCTYVVEYGRLLNDAVASLSTASTDAALIRFVQTSRTTSYVIGGLYAINITLGDIIVWWRVWVLWQKRTIMAFGLVLIVGTFGFGIVSTIHFQVDAGVQPLMAYGDLYGGVSGLLTFISNVLATSLIGRKAWEHRKLLLQSPGASKGRWNTPTIKVLILLVESGTIYSVIFSVAVINNVMMRSESSLAPSALEFLSLSTVFFTGCLVPILAIYPTLIIFIVSLNRSEIDSTLANCTPSDIPTNLFPSMHFSGSQTEIHLPPSPRIDGPLHSDRTIHDAEGQLGEDRSHAQEAFKPDEAGRLV